MKESFLDMIEDHQGILFKVCRIYRDTLEDQQDLFQDVILQLWKSYPTFRGDSKISSWIYRIALNTAIASFRKRRIVYDNHTEFDIAIHPISTNGISSNEERLFEAIRKLSDDKRAIIALYFEGYSHKEIGDILGISENYVGVKMNRIKNKLKKLLL